jgi:hypothetical protein
MDEYYDEEIDYGQEYDDQIEHGFNDVNDMNLSSNYNASGSEGRNIRTNLEAQMLMLKDDDKK